MKSLGFSEYESKAYIALLEENPATAYEIAKKSAIPTSKIYETISKLLEKEIITELIEKNKKRYVPCIPDELIENLSSKINSNLTLLKQDFSNISFKQNVSNIVNIGSYETLMHKSRSLINSAKRSILISGWDTDLDNLKEHINKSRIRKSAICFGQKPAKLKATMFQHPAEHTLFTEKGGRQFVLISDSSAAIAGTIFEDNTVEAVWSANQGFVTLAEDYIKHDIYILKVANRFSELLISTYGKDYEKLRDIYSDEVVQ